MIYFYIYLSLSRPIFYSSLENNTAEYLILFLTPLENVEIKVKKRTGTIFSKWPDYLYLDVEAINSDEEIEKYGPFNSENNLQALHFQTKNYTLKLVNEGQDNIKIAMVFSTGNSIFIRNIFSNDFEFPFIGNKLLITDFNQFDYPFIYDAKEDDGLSIMLIFFLSLLVANSAIIVIFGLIDSCFSKKN